jgi:hypothetical protein
MNQRKNTALSIPTVTFSTKKKNSDPFKVDSENFGHQECNFRKKLLTMRVKAISKQVLDFV